MRAPLKPSACLHALRETCARHRYSTPLFLLREAFAAFHRHKGFTLSASLSFYALFALIPMALLMFFLLSHLVTSSGYAIAKLTLLTGNLVPKFSHRIMIEVYNISRHKAIWGVFGMIALFCAVIPLTGALRDIFHTITGTAETRSLLRRMFRDALAVLSMLLLFFLFSLSGVLLEKLLAFLEPLPAMPWLTSTLTSLLFSTLLLAAFYRAFFPVRVALRAILIGSLLTAGLWIAMRPAFGLFLLVNQSYGTIFGGMKNMLISIGWLYYSFAIFLLGTELVAALHKRDVLLLKNLFGSTPAGKGYMDKLSVRFGVYYGPGDRVFREGDEADTMYYLVAGKIEVSYQGKPLRQVVAGEYFGEMATLTGSVRNAVATVTSDRAEILHIRSEQLEALLLEDPRIAMTFLREMAQRLRQASGMSSAIN